MKTFLLLSLLALLLLVSSGRSDYPMKTLLSLLALLSLLLLASSASAGCVVNGTVQDCTLHVTWDWAQGSGDPADGFNLEQQINSGAWGPSIAGIPVADRSVDKTIQNDLGNTTLCYRLFAFNSAGQSDPSNTACTTTPIINVVSLKTTAVVTTSHRAGDTSSIIAILVNQNTNIGAGGLELTYPANMTLTVSRRATNTSSVIAILVNKSTAVIINSAQP